MKLLKKIAILSLSAIPLSVQAKDTGIKGYEIYEGEYISTLLLGDITHDYIGKPGFYDLAYFTNTEENGFFHFTIKILDSGATQAYFTFDDYDAINWIDWEATKLSKPEARYYFVSNTNIPIYFKRPLQATGINSEAKKYISQTDPAQTFAAAYDGFIPSFYYTSISGNKSFDRHTSVSSLLIGTLWKSGDVSSLKIEKDNFIIQYYYVVASVKYETEIYDVWLRAYAKGKDGGNSTEFNMCQLAHVNLMMKDAVFSSYDFPFPVSTLDVTPGYYNVIRSGGAYGLTDSVKNYEEGYKDGQGNPTFKSFIVSAFEACSAFFALPVLGQHITIGALIGSFVGLGALFLLIKLFR